MLRGRRLERLKVTIAANLPTREMFGVMFTRIRVDYGDSRWWVRPCMYALYV
jgi:hypothetical protein